MLNGIRSLQFAVRWRVIAHHSGQLLLIVAALISVPALLCLFAADYAAALRYLLVIVMLLLAGIGGSVLKSTRDIQRNEALVISVLVFIITALVMVLPMMSYGLGFADALFETVSAVTTTGLSTLATVDDKPLTFLFARAWLQWVGGLGVVVLALALFISPGTASMRLGFDKRETSGIEGGTRAHAKRLLMIYVILTVLGIVLLLLLGSSFSEAVIYALAAISTGGFANGDASLLEYGHWYQRFAVLFISLLGAVIFSWYFLFRDKGIRVALADPRPRFLLLGCTISSLLVGATLAAEQNWSLQGWLHGIASAISAQTTAGFAAMPIAQMPAISQLLLTGSMLVGGDLGSTAGGIKIFRFLICLRLLQLLLQRIAITAQGVVIPKVYGKKLESSEVEAAVAIVFAYLLVISLSWLCFVAYGYPPLPALFDVVSATATVGLSAGIVGPDLPLFLKSVLCMDMLMGRMEIIAVIVLVLPGTWFGKRRSSL
jgi:trk system potassium uptake protein TrkH